MHSITRQILDKPVTESCLLLKLKHAANCTQRVTFWFGLFINTLCNNVHKINKKLSYRKQIARKLRTQFVDGIYSRPNSVTLKFGEGSFKVIGNGTIE